MVKKHLREGQHTVLAVMILIPILTLILVIILLFKVSDLQRTVEILSGASNKQQHIAEVTPEILEELKYLKSAGLDVTAESKLKAIGFSTAEARAFIASL